MGGWPLRRVRLIPPDAALKIKSSWCAHIAIGGNCMHRSSLVPRPLSLSLGLALLALPQLVGPARAADKFVKVTFDTVDGVTLQGSFYASPKGKDEPTVLLLHKITGDSHKDNWPRLADVLNEKGYTVLSFD